MINNRQNGRRRGRGGGGGGGNGGGPRPNGGGGRADNGNRIDNRARGNAAQLLEKYRNLASDAQRQGDRVNTEYYLQFADHYFRVLADQRGRFEEQQPRRPQADFELDGDEEYGDEGEPIRVGEQQAAEPARAERRDRWQDREPDGGARQQRDPAPARQAREEVAGQHLADPPVAGESLDARAEAVMEADAPLAPPPRRRGRPPRAATPVVEGAAVVEADRLPPALGIGAASESDDAPRPRRRRKAVAAEMNEGAE